jgi:hypothetical protein
MKRKEKKRKETNKETKKTQYIINKQSYNNEYPEKKVLY